MIITTQSSMVEPNDNKLILMKSINMKIESKSDMISVKNIQMLLNSIKSIAII